MPETLGISSESDKAITVRERKTAAAVGNMVVELGVFRLKEPLTRTTALYSFAVWTALSGDEYR